MRRKVAGAATPDSVDVVDQPGQVDRLVADVRKAQASVPGIESGIVVERMSLGVRESPPSPPPDDIFEPPEPPVVPTFEDLPRRIRDARNHASHLNTATDQLNVALAEVEAALVRLKLGVQGWVELAPDDSADEAECHLVFKRHDGHWCLLIAQEQDPSDPRDISYTPIAKASRSLRMQAASKVPALVDALIDATASQIEQVERSTAMLSSLTEKLREAQS